MESNSQVVPVELENGSVVRILATLTGSSEQLGEQEEVESDVSLNLRPLREVTDSITEIAKSIKSSIEAVKPTKASVEFGVEFGYESGQLTAIIVQGTGTANLKISLEWNQEK